MEPTFVIEYHRIERDGLTANLREVLIDVHAKAFGDEMQNPFHQRFPWFIDHWASRDGFACVIAYEAETKQPVGFAYGAPAAPGKEWWRNSWTAPGDPSTFSVSELMVLPEWRGTGEGRRLHDYLLDSRPEALTVLLVDTTHPKVLALYTRWGYEKVGEQTPFPDSPLYAVMIKSLR
jgi:ribosomal protein S18 acetylase RimI-like enzyme